LADAPPAARVRDAGGILVAKTTMPDYGMLSSGLSSFHKLARNPWNLGRTPGGSSAGAGAAAAAGYGPLHVGTDIGGSLRLPAGWCGIFTLKPSLGRIPIDPPYTGRAAGPMTRSVADSAWFMQVLSRPDPRDSMSLPFQDIAWNEFDAGVEKLKGLRIGLMLEAGCG
jgi:aspartyl-tRNA(Asn)/glutamyl-tRNA(Gln) amidotransferase subunit A